MLNLKSMFKFCLFLVLLFACISPIKAENTLTPVEEMVLNFFETPEAFAWYDANGNDVSDQFYDENITLYLEGDLETIMTNLRSKIVSGVEEIVEKVEENTIQPRVCIGDCPESSATFTYMHKIWNNVYSGVWGGSFEAIYYGKGYYYVKDGVVTGIDSPSIWKDSYTDACAGTNYTVTLQATGTPNLSTKKVNYSARFYVLEETFQRGGYTSYYNDSISIYSDSN